MDNDTNGLPLASEGSLPAGGLHMSVMNAQNEVVADQVTDAGASETCFTDLPATTYRVLADPPAGYLATQQRRWSISLPSDATVTVPFGVQIDPAAQNRFPIEWAVIPASLLVIIGSIVGIAVWLRRRRRTPGTEHRVIVPAASSVCLRTGRACKMVRVRFPEHLQPSVERDGLDLAGIRQDQLSPLAAPVAVLGKLQSDIAARMGIPANTPLITGASDAVNSSIGAGAVAPTQATLMIGTSGALRVVSPRPVIDPRARSWCYAIDETHWLVGGAINNGGSAVSWLRDCLNQARSERLLTVEDILALASRAPAGSGGMICLPFFAGERSPNWNLNARGAFYGISIEHELRHLARALLEGIGFRFKSLLQVLTEIGLDVKQIVVSGGFTKSNLWLQIMADILGRELDLPVWGETSGLAAAFWAALAAGCAESVEGIRKWVQIDQACRPAPDNTALYDRVYPQYMKLWPRRRARRVSLE